MKKTKDPHYVKSNRDYYNNLLIKFQEFNNNGKKTICYFCDTYYPIIDGVIVVLNNYAKQLALKYNVIVCVPKHKGLVTISKDYIVVGVSSMFFKFVNYDLAFPELDNEFKSIIKKLRIDLIHSHSPFNMGNFACKLARKRQIPLVCTFHSQYKQDFYKATKNKVLTNMLLDNIMKNFKPATEVWTMHNRGLKLLRDYGYKGRTFLIPNSTDKIRPDNLDILRQKANERWNLSSEQNVFIFVGRLITQKNILLIPQALKILKDRNIPFKMLYLGNGPDENKLRKLISELNLDNEIKLLGRIEGEELSMAYARASLMLFPSMYDNSSIVQIEAATYDTPCLMIKDSLTAGTITENINGFLTSNNVTAYAEKIIEILNNKELYNKVVLNVFKDLHITHEEVAQQVSIRYEYLMAQNEKRKQKIQTLTKKGKKIAKQQQKITTKYI